MTTSINQYPELRDHYTRMAELGEGAFGRVYLAEKHPHLLHESQSGANQNHNINNIGTEKPSSSHQNTQKTSCPARFFAVKKLKPYMRKKHINPNMLKIENYPEIEVMRGLQHNNVMAIREIIQENKGYEMAHYLVLDLGITLMELFKHKEISLSFQMLRHIVFQMIQGLQHIHERGYMHRDVKTSNIYLTADGTLKIGDFSISRRAWSEQTEEMMLAESQQEKTGNVTTRYYRAPEIIYGSKHYDQSIDIWGLGCTLAELLLHQPVFPGTTDINQLQLIFNIIGYPQEQWPEAENLPYYLQFDNSKPKVGLNNLLPNVPPLLLDFISRALVLDPKKRATVQELRGHALLQEISGDAKVELGKICGYLHEKCIKNWFAKMK